MVKIITVEDARGANVVQGSLAHSGAVWNRPQPRDVMVAREPDASWAIAAFGQLAEPLVTLAIGHLCAATRHKLASNELSVNAYPAGCGGFVYVGIPAYDEPEETDLAEIFRVAEDAGVAWLKFDASGATVDGLPVYPA